jgi:succinate dehydrogenase/fumarate reductase flavoprotein subunit
MKEGLIVLQTMQADWEVQPSPSLDQLETANLLTVARIILRSALLRLESRGAHYRADYPEKNDAEFRFHSWTRSGEKTLIGTRPF